MPKATKASRLLTATALTLFSALAAAQQMKEDIRLPKPKRFIDKVEVIAGPSLHFPDDNGWSDRVKNGSNGASTYRIKKKAGYSAGLGVVHSFGNRFEIHGRVLIERKGYVEDNMMVVENDNIIKFNFNSINDYISFCLTPSISFGKESKFHFYSGVTYSRLTKSIVFSTEYLNGQKQSVSRYVGGAEDYEACILMGFGYSIDLNKKIAITIQLQGNYGITDIRNENKYIIRSNSLALFTALKYNRLKNY